MRRSLLLAAVGAVLCAVCYYITDTNRCYVPYLYEWGGGPPQYEFWCVRYENPLTLSYLLGIAFFAGGLVTALIQYIRKSLWT